MFGRGNTLYVEDSFDTVLARGRTLASDLKDRSLQLEEARSKVQALLVDFDQTIGGPTLSTALAGAHERVSGQGLSNLSDSLPRLLDTLQQQAENIRNLNNNIRF